MSKKIKSQTRKTSGIASSSSTSTTTFATSTTGRSFEREFNPDYTPVVKDLRRIGTLAGTFFLVLIVLSFILK